MFECHRPPLNPEANDWICAHCQLHERRTPMNPCDRAAESLTVEQMIEVIETSPPGPWPHGWEEWSNVNDALARMLEKRVKDSQPYPEGKHEGRGIVVSVNAKPGWSSGKNLPNGYFPGAWVLVNELRRHGCELPILFTHLGTPEWDPMLTRLVKPLGVTVMDLREQEKSDPWRILAGWESKLAGILWAPFREVLYLDADNVPLHDPSFLFDAPEYLEKGALFWPDLPPSTPDHKRKEWLPEACWNSCGMAYRKLVDAESGQLLIDKERCWTELTAARFLNEHSDRFYKVVFGDKSTFTLGWWKTAEVMGKGPAYNLVDTPAGWDGSAILQHEPGGRILFQHCVRNKPSLSGYSRRHLHHQEECDGHLKELRKLWSGKLWRNDRPNQREREIIRQVAGRQFAYRRLINGEPARNMALLPGGRIGEGAAECEARWEVHEVDWFSGTECVLTLCGEDKPTCHLRRGADGTWRGEWLEHERMQVEVAPIPEEVEVDPVASLTEDVRSLFLSRGYSPPNVPLREAVETLAGSST